MLTALQDKESRATEARMAREQWAEERKALRESGDKMAAVKAVLEEELAASKGDRRRLNARVLY